MGGSAAVAKLHASARDPLFLRVDAAANSVAHNDPDHAQAGTLPAIRLSASGTGVIITASGVNLPELQGMQTLRPGAPVQVNNAVQPSASLTPTPADQ